MKARQEASLVPLPFEGYQRSKRVIGSGAYGAVYAGVGPGGTAIAVKVAYDGHQDFSREGEILSALQGLSGVVQYITHDAQHLVTRLLRGEDLQKKIHRGWKPAPLEAVGIAVSICQTLASVHAFGIIHGDIKPENILLCDDGVYIVDFGTARKVDDQPERTDFVLGSPQYMSPEQMRGSNIDGRTDVWALACCLFFLLTHGQELNPVTEEDPKVFNMEAHYSEVVDRNFEIKLRAAKLPNDIIRILMRMLTKEREGRPYAHQALRELHQPLIKLSTTSTSVQIINPAVAAGTHEITNPPSNESVERLSTTWPRVQGIPLKPSRVSTPQRIPRREDPLSLRFQRWLRQRWSLVALAAILWIAFPLAGFVGVHGWVIYHPPAVDRGMIKIPIFATPVRAEERPATPIFATPSVKPSVATSTTMCVRKPRQPRSICRRSTGSYEPRRHERRRRRHRHHRH